MSIQHGNDDAALELAAEQALDLRATLSDLSDPMLHKLIDLLLLEIGIKLARRSQKQRP